MEVQTDQRLTLEYQLWRGRGKILTHNKTFWCYQMFLQGTKRMVLAQSAYVVISCLKNLTGMMNSVVLESTSFSIHCFDADYSGYCINLTVVDTIDIRG